MKVEGPDRSRQAGQAKKKGGVSSGDGSFGDMVAAGAGGAQETASGRNIARVDVLLAAQAADDPAQRSARRRGVRRGDLLLDALEGVRIALLSGSLTVGHLIDIADVVASHREKIMDPRLTAVLDEIDLRAQVELAKLRAALDAGQGG